MKNKAAAVILNFFLRAVMGICLIYSVNQYVLPDQDSWSLYALWNSGVSKFVRFSQKTAI